LDNAAKKEPVQVPPPRQEYFDPAMEAPLPGQKNGYNLNVKDPFGSQAAQQQPVRKNNPPTVDYGQPLSPGTQL
jgi:hypothetical protein